MKLLQKSALELLTTYRRLQAQKFSSVVAIVTTDFEAPYAYKRGDYQRCLQLSTQNVRKLLHSPFIYIPYISKCPETFQFLDNDIFSLTALIVIVDPKRSEKFDYRRISQQTLSLYLMTQCPVSYTHLTLPTILRV